MNTIHELARLTLITGALHDIQTKNLQLYAAVLFHPMTAKISFFPGDEESMRRFVEVQVERCPRRMPGSKDKFRQEMAENIRRLIGSDLDVRFVVGQDTFSYPSSIEPAIFKLHVKPQSPGEQGAGADGGGAAGFGRVDPGLVGEADSGGDVKPNVPAVPPRILLSRHQRPGVLPRVLGGSNRPRPTRKSLG